MRDFQSQKRVTVTKSANPFFTRLMLGIVLGAIAFLAFLVFASRESPVEAIKIQSAARIYLIDSSLQELRAVDAQTKQLVYGIPGVDVVRVSPDQTMLYVSTWTSLAAHDAATGTQRWQLEFDGYESKTHPQSSLLIHPNGNTLYTLEYSPINPDLLVFNERWSANGERTGTTLLVPPRSNMINAMLSPDGSRIYIQTANGLSLISILDRKEIAYTQLPPAMRSEETAIGLDQSGRHLYLLAHKPTGEVLFTTFDALTLAYNSPEYNIWGNRLDITRTQIAPDGQRFAVPMLDENGTSNGLMIAEFASPYATTIFEAPAGIRSIAWAYAGTEVYVLAEQDSSPSVQVYNPRSGLLGALRFEHPAHTMLVGASAAQTINLPTALPRPMVLPTAEPIPPTPAPPNMFERPEHMPAPQPYTIPLTEDYILTITSELSATSPVVWLEIPDKTNDTTQIMGITNNGDRLVLHTDYDYSINAPTHAPIIIRDAEIEHYGSLIFTEGATEPLHVPVILRECQYNPTIETIMCLKNFKKFIKVNLNTGDYLNFDIDIPGKNQLIGVNNAGNALINSLNPEQQTIIQLEVGSDSVIQSEIMTLPESSQIVFAAASNRLYYNQDTNLISYDLTTNQATTIAQYDTIAMVLGFWQVAPNGHAIAYAKPSSNEGLFDIFVYDQRDHTFRLVYGDQPFIQNSLLWTNDSSAVMFKTTEPADSPQRERLWIVQLNQVEPWNFYTSYALPNDTIEIQAATPERIFGLVYKVVDRDLVLFQPSGIQRWLLSTEETIRPRLLYAQ